MSATDNYIKVRFHRAKGNKIADVFCFFNGHDGSIRKAISEASSFGGVMSIFRREGVYGVPPEILEIGTVPERLRGEGSADAEDLPS